MIFNNKAEKKLGLRFNRANIDLGWLAGMTEGAGAKANPSFDPTDPNSLPYLKPSGWQTFIDPQTSAYQNNANSQYQLAPKLAQQQHDTSLGLKAGDVAKIRTLIPANLQVDLQGNPVSDQQLAITLNNTDPSYLLNQALSYAKEGNGYIGTKSQADLLDTKNQLLSSQGQNAALPDANREMAAKSKLAADLAENALGNEPFRKVTQTATDIGDAYRAQHPQDLGLTPNEGSIDVNRGTIRPTSNPFYEDKSMAALKNLQGGLGGMQTMTTPDGIKIGIPAKQSNGEISVLPSGNTMSRPDYSTPSSPSIRPSLGSMSILRDLQSPSPVAQPVSMSVPTSSITSAQGSRPITMENSGLLGVVGQRINNPISSISNIVGDATKYSSLNTPEQIDSYLTNNPNTPPDVVKMLLQKRNAPRLTLNDVKDYLGDIYTGTKGYLVGTPER